jgi:hypothetical protein
MNAPRITRAWLDQWKGISVEDMVPGAAYQLVFTLKGLARYVLEPGIVNKAADYLGSLSLGDSPKFLGWFQPGELECRVGSCWALVANLERERYPWLRSGFILPLQWKSGCQHHPHLPRKLLQVADDVIHRLKDQKGILEDRSWGLHPDPCLNLEGVDLSEIDWEFESAWVSLAGGLFLACWEALPRAGIFASAGFGEDGIKQVDGLAAKAEAILELLGRGRLTSAHLFVCESQAEELRSRLEAENFAGLKVSGLPAGKKNVKEILKDYLYALEVPPDRDAPEERRAEYFLRIPSEQEAKKYYRGYILPDVVCKLQKKCREKNAEITHLVSVPSFGYSITELLIAGLQVRKLLLVVMEEDSDKSEPSFLEEELERLKAEHPQLQEIFRVRIRKSGSQERDELLQQLRHSCKEFLKDVDARQVAFDLTSGPKILTVSLYDCCPPGAVAVCVNTRFDKESRRHRPFTEAVYLWRKE